MLFMVTLVLLLSAPNFVNKTYQVSAAPKRGSRPTNINMSYMNETDLRAYYNDIDGKKADDLVAGLHNIIKDHEEYSYEDDKDREIYKIIDRNWELSPLSPNELTSYNYSDNPYIIKLYADYNDDVKTADRFKNDGARRVSFDKEHIWPQSYGEFDRKFGAGSDLHALWPSDVRGNQNAHNNNHYGNVDKNATVMKDDKNGSSGTRGLANGYSETIFEPADEFKGDIARAMFYMPSRYYVYVDNQRPKLQLVNDTPDTVIANATTPGLAGILDTLLEWNELDPVSEHEIRRNNLLFNNYQKNRNPFIDYPQWARIAYDTAYKGSGTNLKKDISSVGEETRVLTSISLDTTKVKTKYKQNETFSLDNIVVKATFDDNISQIVNGYTSSIAVGSKLTDLGEHTVSISYEHNEIVKEATFAIVIIENINALNSISLDISNVKTNYTVDEMLRLDYLIVTAHYKNDTSRVVTDFTSSIEVYSVLKTTGEQKVTITYTENGITKQAAYDILVKPKQTGFLQFGDISDILRLKNSGLFIIILLGFVLILSFGIYGFKVRIKQNKK